MSPRVLELPNVEAAVNIGINGATFTDSAGEEVELKAYSSTPKKDPSWPHVVSMRLGGPPAEKHALDAPRIQVEAWGDTDTDKSTVLNCAAAAWKAMLELESETVELSDGTAVFITAVEPEIGLQWLPDPSTARPRYLFAMRVYARSVQATS